MGLVVLDVAGGWTLREELHSFCNFYWTSSCFWWRHSWFRMSYSMCNLISHSLGIAANQRGHYVFQNGFERLVSSLLCLVCRPWLWLWMFSIRFILAQRAHKLMITWSLASMHLWAQSLLTAVWWQSWGNFNSRVPLYLVASLHQEACWKWAVKIDWKIGWRDDTVLLALPKMIYSSCYCV